MTDELDGLASLDDQISGLEQTIGGAQAVTAAFEGQLTRMREGLAETGRDVGQLSGSFSRGLRRSLDGLILDGRRLSDTLSDLGQSMLSTAYSAAVRPVTNGLGDLVAGGVESIVSGILPFADGAGFTQGRVMPFARGGVVSGPVSFPMRNGIGLMGEAGPEAIMPLSRGADGRLGVQASGGGRPVTVVMNVTTPDAEGFRRSQSQIAAQLGRALGRGQRNR